MSSDPDQRRDHAEERYWAEFCPACGTSPCEWDGRPGGLHPHRPAEHDDVVAAAVHEAGHVVGEYALGHRVHRARLDWCGGGRTSLGWWAWRPLADAVIASLAGPAAEALWRDTPLRVVLAEDACAHDRTRVQRWLGGRDIEAHARRAGELVACGWPLVARVAAILAVRRRITHRDLRRLAISLPTPVPAPGPGGPSGKNAHRAGLPHHPYDEVKGPTMLQTQTCVIVHCDQCGNGPCDPDLPYHWAVERHWPTESAALDALAAQGWQADGAGLRCPDCAAVAVCAADGHDFGEWVGCPCGGGRPGHPAGPDRRCERRYRYCDRCDLAELTTTTTTAATTAAAVVAGDGGGVVTEPAAGAA